MALSSPEYCNRFDYHHARQISTRAWCGIFSHFENRNFVLSRVPLLGGPLMSVAGAVIVAEVTNALCSLEKCRQIHLSIFVLSIFFRRAHLA